MKTKRGGFTLIEVVLAVFIVAVGVLSVAALFSRGLAASAKAINDTNAAMFAENVFSGLRARSQLLAEMNTGSSTWTAFWQSFAAKTTGITVAASAPGASLWMSPAMIKVGGPYTQRYINAAMHGGNVTGIADRVFRYRIDAAKSNSVQRNTALVKICGVTNSLGWIYYTSTAYQVRILLWDGEFGGTNIAEALMFYSEFANQGTL